MKGRGITRLLLISLLLVGCREGESTSDVDRTIEQATTSGEYWSRSQVEVWLKEDLSLTSLDLQSTGDHNFTGTGQRTDGKSLQIQVRQVKGGIRADWVDGRGASGYASFGEPVPET